jgi:hypothetical protein
MAKRKWTPIEYKREIEEEEKPTKKTRRKKK